MSTETAARRIETWPQESREAAQLVIDAHGEPDDASDGVLIWYDRGPWKRISASRTFYRHNFPVPHTDSVESVVDYRVPVDKVAEIFEFDGSVVVERTAGEVSARCHDEQANFLALNLMHDIVSGTRTIEQAREYYAKEFMDFRRKQPTPYMERLHFKPDDDDPADPDQRVLSDQDLEDAVAEGERGH